MQVTMEKWSHPLRLAAIYDCLKNYKASLQYAKDGFYQCTFHETGGQK